MATYAKDTQVSVDRSKGEIERILQRYGAEKFMQGWDQEKAVIAFTYEGRTIQMKLPLPDKADFALTPGRQWERKPEDALKHWEQACRQSWRALALMIKAKLAGVESGIATMENEFLAYTLLPSGETIGENTQEAITKMIKTGTMPKLLTA
jgi:hypothetical protein